MEKIKVCHFVSGLKAGGVETMIYNYSQNMNKDNYEFHLVYQHNPELKNIEEFEKLGFKLNRISSKTRNPIKNIIETYSYIKENNFDVIHSHMTLMNVIPLTIAKYLGVKKRISHSHNSDVRKKFFFIKLVENILKKIIINNSTDLVACGFEAGKYLYGDKEFVILNNAINTKLYLFNQKYRDEIRKDIGIGNDVFVIGHVGRFSKQKNHKFLIDVLEKLCLCEKNVRLLLIGDGEEFKNIKSYVEEKKMDEYVIFTGIIRETYKYYSAFDIFVLPSIWEGLPIVAIEAQVSGLRIIFSDNIDKKVMLDEKNVLFEKLNEEVWVKRILDEKNNNKIKNRDFNTDIMTKKSFDLHDNIKKLEEIYKRMDENNEKNSNICK